MDAEVADLPLAITFDNRSTGVLVTCWHQLLVVTRDAWRPIFNLVLYIRLFFYEHGQAYNAEWVIRKTSFFVLAVKTQLPHQCKLGVTGGLGKKKIRKVAVRRAYKEKITRGTVLHSPFWETSNNDVSLWLSHHYVHPVILHHQPTWNSCPARKSQLSIHS